MAAGGLFHGDATVKLKEHPEYARVLRSCGVVVVSELVHEMCVKPRPAGGGDAPLPLP